LAVGIIKTNDSNIAASSIITIIKVWYRFLFIGLKFDLTPILPAKLPLQMERFFFESVLKYVCQGLQALPTYFKIAYKITLSGL
jgi:hypothetical protein